MATRTRSNGHGIRASRKKRKPGNRGWKWLLLFTGFGLIIALSSVIVSIFGAISAAAAGYATITQHLVRHVFMTTEERFDRSMSRKIKEALLAYQLTQKLTKSQILQMYLNE